MSDQKPSLPRAAQGKVKHGLRWKQTNKKLEIHKQKKGRQTHLKKRPSSFRAENVPRVGRAPPPLVPDTDFISDKSGDCAQVLQYNTMQYKYDCSQLVECNTIQIQLPAVATQAIVFGPSLRHISLRAPRTRGPALPPCV